MSSTYAITLAALVAALLLARLLLPQLPVRRAVRLSTVDAVLLGVGVLGLVFHCTAMFARSVVAAVDPLVPLIDAVNALGAASMVLYIVPALLVLFALRRVYWAALIVLALALVAVGVTMYDGGSLSVHLVAIFISVVVLATVVVSLVIPPWRAHT